jgi:hypothetical protein
VALRKSLILTKPRSGCLEARIALIQPMSISTHARPMRFSATLLTVLVLNGSGAIPPASGRDQASFCSSGSNIVAMTSFERQN